MRAEAEFYNAVCKQNPTVALQNRLSDGSGAVVEVIGADAVVISGYLYEEEDRLRKLLGRERKELLIVLGGETEGYLRFLELIFPRNSGSVGDKYPRNELKI